MSAIAQLAIVLVAFSTDLCNSVVGACRVRKPLPDGGWRGDCFEARMLLPTETEMSENARVLAAALRAPVEGEDAADVKQRAEGEFLRRLVAKLEPMLRASMRSHRIVLASDAYGVVALKSDGIFVHVGIADQEDVLEPLRVLDAEPSLLTILDRIEDELVAANDARATSAADVVRLARSALEVAC